LQGGQPATLGIRPQYLRPSDTGALRGNVTVSERLGTETVVEIALASGGTIMAALPEDVLLKPGEAIAFDFDASQAHIFGETR
jgi:multiple sugar transport system ATP-binding protein